MGPLHGVRVVEMAGLAPVPFSGMLLADLGAEVIRVDRKGGGGYAPPPGPLDRGKTTVELNLKDSSDRAQLQRLTDAADVFLEGFRPGVAERLGIGPEVLAESNPRLIYGRLTGWGQDGPLAARVGHDINYIALSGALEVIGRRGERPVPPVNIVGDFAGGSMLLVIGVLGALNERHSSGKGQVIDAAMVDGSSLLLTFLHGLRDVGMWNEERGTNMLDGAAAYYDTYETADGKYVAVGAVEPEFFAELIEKLDLDSEDFDFQIMPSSWPKWRAALTKKFLQKSRAEWAEIFAESDACVAPVLSPWEAPDHPHNRARDAFVEVGGLRQPAPAPRFARTPSKAPQPMRTTSVDAAIHAWATPQT